MPPVLTQRWHHGTPRWRPVAEGGFDADRYEVAPIDEATAGNYVRTHHYAKSLPSTTHRYGLIDHDAGERRLLGVATLGVPMSRAVLTNVFPSLVPYQESLELNRLVLADAVPGNGESWFCARVFHHAATHHGLRGVVTFADPVPRWRVSGDSRTLIKPGHLGIVYQALGFEALGRSTPRSLVVLPDATTLTARSLAKVTGGETGAAGVIARLVALGAPHPDHAAQAELSGIAATRRPPTTRALRLWLKQALDHIGAGRLVHPGNYRFATRTGTRAQRTRTVIALAATPYPKPDPAPAA
ncbi:hypothetical protein [Kutzneria buriramensis]|uniref:Uncharacterized protein n=1 Tax=Kutzneria buriramensis TaxID=1045776 RepID=A0A3E0GYE3_9PSEU|nr:hypothetical protein [Kutzneria buriramensis]REH31072.1 hypothetical protein BCF44_12295 [Kutzneria buriramensis]